jgi:DNA-binding NarL/FixJ family response regulator
MQPIRVLVAERDPLRRARLGAEVQAPGLLLAGVTGDVEHLVGAALESRPAVVLVGLDPTCPALDALRELRARMGDAVRIVACSREPDSGEMVAALQAGADGYLAGDPIPAGLAEAVRGLLRGEAAMSRRMAAHLVDGVRDGRLPAPVLPAGRLTPRQLEILRLIAAGESTADIAARLFLSPETVRWHVKAILRRLGARSRAEAAAALRASSA